MPTYGSVIFSTTDAPHPFDGVCENYSYRDAYQVTEVEGETDLVAAVLHRRKGEFSFDATVTAASTNFFDLSSGQKIALTGIATGVCLLTQAVERWQLGQAKQASLQGAHYPDVTAGEGDAEPGELSAVSPTQTPGPIVRPADAVIFGTKGLTHTAGVVQALTLTQSVQVQEFLDESEAITAVATHGYKREIDLEIIAALNSALPALNSELTITGAPDHAGGYIVTNAEKRYAKRQQLVYSVKALWLPVFGD